MKLLRKKRKARVMVLVLIFMAVVTLMTSATVVIVSRYQRNLVRHVEELRERVNPPEEEGG